jgi:phosphopantothenoylcysteine decarboxylase/phosphopantothenate--cysteine ligase
MKENLDEMLKKSEMLGSEEVLDTGVRVKSDRLSRRKVAFGVCGGIGAVESVKGIRELRRHGAEVFPFFSDSASRFITELSVSWAAGRPVVTSLFYQVEHLDTFDLVVIAPLTLHSLSKIALGLADDPVSMLAASQLGKKTPFALIPTMNEALEKHPLYRSYRQRLEEWGCSFRECREENRLKMLSPAALGEFAIECLS